MAKCKFNDYTLPEPPAGWNQTTHPHAMIVEQQGTMTFNLVVHSHPLSVRVVDGVECIGFDPSAEVLGWAYTRGDDWVWTAMGEAPEAEDGLTWRYYKPDKIAWVWCNHDICDESGAVVYAASEPVPVQEEEPKKFPLKSWLMGLALALAGKPRLLAKREPVAWLYNGVPLPKLPETVYPRLSISGNIYAGINKYTRYLWAYTEPVVATGNNVTSTLVVPNPCLRWKLEDGAWVEYPFEADKTSDNAIVGLWANYDVYYVDDATSGEVFGFEPGSRFLAKSDPIPVYE